MVVGNMQVIDGMNTATLIASVAGVLISIHAVAQIFRLLLVMYQREPREWSLMLYWLCVMFVIALTASGWVFSLFGHPPDTSAFRTAGIFLMFVVGINASRERMMRC